MNRPGEPEPAEPTHEQLRSLLLDDHLAALRQGYSTTMLAILVSLADWLAVDAWLGGGKVAEPDEPQPDESSYPSFRAISIVLCMAAELTESAVTMTAARCYYAVGAAVRQLIECEYLLALFNQDLDHASTWIRSTPAEIRATFSPAKMRKRTGTFSNQEYWSHSDTGGHPAPKGARLLEKFDPHDKSGPTRPPNSPSTSACTCTVSGARPTRSSPSTTPATPRCALINGAEQRKRGLTGERQIPWSTSFRHCQPDETEGRVPSAQLGFTVPSSTGTTSSPD